MLVLIVTGPLYLFTENDPLSVFGWFAVSFDLRVLEWIHEPAEEVHKMLGTYILPLLLILHIGGGFATSINTVLNSRYFSRVKPLSVVRRLSL
jgi:cytochrome b561